MKTKNADQLHGSVPLFSQMQKSIFSHVAAQICLFHLSVINGLIQQQVHIVSACYLTKLFLDKAPGGSKPIILQVTNTFPEEEDNFPLRMFRTPLLKRLEQRPCYHFSPFSVRCRNVGTIENLITVLILAGIFWAGFL